MCSENADYWRYELAISKVDHTQEYDRAPVNELVDVVLDSTNVDSIAHE